MKPDRERRRPSDNDEQAKEAAGQSGHEVTSCDLCGRAMYEFHCRLICSQCGYQRDCSDP